MNKLVEKLIDVAPLLTTFLQMDIAISISDTEKYLALFETDTLKFPFKTGTNIRTSGYGALLDKMAKTGESVVNFVPKEVTGTVPVKSIVSPIMDQNSVVGYFSISINRDKESKADETFLGIIESMHSFAKAADDLNTHMNTIQNEFKRAEENIAAGNQAIKLIHGISRQTNLLSLNASIESARVGAAGAGFSIVASEMRKLSIQTKEISDHVEESFVAIESSVSQSMEKLYEVKELSNTQCKYTDEITSSIGHVLQNTGK